MRAVFAPLALLGACLSLSACGLQPMYGGGGDAGVARGLAAVEVPTIPGRAGWLLRNDLNDRLGIAGDVGTRYRLDVTLDDSLEALGVLNDDTISRERRILRARYQLVDLASGEILLDATSGSDAGIDVVSSEYATIAAEQTALENLSREIADRIVRRVALALREVTTRHWLRVASKEALVGALNGVAIAITTGLGVVVWSGSWGLAMVIGVSMVISMVAAGLSGAAIPMVLTRLGQDPAQSSSIILTTVTDVVGFFSFLGIATALSTLL